MQGSSGRDLVAINERYEVQDNRKKLLRELERVSLTLLEAKKLVEKAALKPLAALAITTLRETVRALRNAVDKEYKNVADQEG